MTANFTGRNLYRAMQKKIEWYARIKIKRLFGLSGSHRVAEYEDDGITTKEHFLDEAVFVNGFAFLLALS